MLSYPGSVVGMLKAIVSRPAELGEFACSIAARRVHTPLPDSVSQTLSLVSKSVAGGSGGGWNWATVRGVDGIYVRSMPRARAGDQAGGGHQGDDDQADVFQENCLPPRWKRGFYAGNVWREPRARDASALTVKRQSCRAAWPFPSFHKCQDATEEGFVECRRTPLSTPYATAKRARMLPAWQGNG